MSDGAAGALSVNRGVSHVGLTVSDIEVATRFFTGLLGIVEFYDHGPHVDETGDCQAVYFDRHPRSGACSSACSAPAT